ncbi:MAG: Mur ligase family protein [Solirubrobacteraceae bacterium]
MSSALPAGPYLVAGLGQAGAAAIEALRAAPACERLLAWDAAGAPGVHGGPRALRRRGVEVFVGGDGAEALAAAGERTTVVKSPGLAPGAPLLRGAAAADLVVWDELELGWRLRRHPTVAVTGTNGKSTTARLLAAILGQSGPPAGNFEFGPALCAAPRDGWLVAEVSSFQLEAAPSVLPHVAVLTNLTDEHLGWHGSRGAYAAAKRRLFVREDGRTAGTSVLNLDDPFGRELAREVAAAGGAVVTYGERHGADVRIAGARWSAAGATVVLDRAAGELTLTTALPGAHNARNVAAAVAAAGALGRPDAEVAAAVAATPRLPGRWERIEGGQPFDVLVDYAHTPDGVRAVLEAARALVDERPGARLRTVLGPVGLADPEKAAGIGRWASRLSDDVMLTSGSAPGSERIPRLAELRRACDGGARVTLRLDRRAAIAEAVGAAREGDVVAVLGLGALGRLLLDRRGTRLAHDDREAARAALRARGWDRWTS